MKTRFPALVLTLLLLLGALCPAAQGAADPSLGYVGPGAISLTGGEARSLARALDSLAGADFCYALLFDGGGGIPVMVTVSGRGRVQLGEDGFVYDFYENRGEEIALSFWILEGGQAVRADYSAGGDGDYRYAAYSVLRQADGVYLLYEDFRQDVGPMGKYLYPFSGGQRAQAASAYAYWDLVETGADGERALLSQLTGDNPLPAALMTPELEAALSEALEDMEPGESLLIEGGRLQPGAALPEFWPFRGQTAREAAALMGWLAFDGGVAVTGDFVPGEVLADALEGYTGLRVSPWAQREVEQARALGLDGAVLDEDLTGPVTRAQFAALAVNLVEQAAGTALPAAPEGTFSDCDGLAVRQAALAGIVNGVGGGRFLPDGPLTRQELAAILCRALDCVGQARGEDLLAAQADLSGYADWGELAPWAREESARLTAAGILRGTGADTLSPEAVCTQEQALLLVLRAWRAVG